MMKILLIEDEEKVVNFIKQGLEEGGYQVDFALDGKEGMVKVLGDEYDLIILDIMLPELSGIDILKKSREQGLKTPILMAFIHVVSLKLIINMKSKNAITYLSIL